MARENCATAGVVRRTACHTVIDVIIVDIARARSLPESPDLSLSAILDRLAVVLGMILFPTQQCLHLSAVNYFRRFLVVCKHSDVAGRCSLCSFYCINL